MNLFITNFYPLDYVLSVITILFIFFSLWKGFIQSVLGLMTWIGSIIVTLIFYQNLANFLSIQINQINFLESTGLSEIIALIIAIPLIFIISLIILRKIRTVISSDVDKATLGIILDKFFGIIYGFIFSYFIFSIIIFLIDQVSTNFLFFLEDNSFILNDCIKFSFIK